MPLFGKSRARLKSVLKLSRARNGDPVLSQRAENNPTSRLLSNNSSAELAKPPSYENGSHSVPISVQSPGEDLWTEAYRRLRQRDKQLVEDFEHILQLESGTSHTTDIAPKPIPTLMQETVSRRVDLWNERRWRFRLGNKQIHLRKKVDEVIKNVLKTKDILLAVGQVDPVHIGLPLAGVCLLLSLASSEVEQRTALLDGLTYISSLIRYYTVVDRVYLCKMGRDAKDTDVKCAMIDLFALMLKFQMSALRYFHQKTLSRLQRNILQTDDWAGMLEAVKEADKTCRSYLNLTDSESINNIGTKVNDIEAKIEEQFKELNEKMQELKDLPQNSLLRECFRCFSVVDYQNIKDEVPPRVPGTCEWILNHPKYLMWLNAQETKLLWITADPGCGKTVLAKSLIDEHLLSLDASPADNICYFFFRDEDQKTKNPAAAISTFLHQFFTQDPSLLERAIPFFQRHGDKLCERLSELWKLFLEVTTCPEAGRTICVIDALDECSEDMQDSMIRLLRGVCSQPEDYPKLKFLVTSQPRISMTESLFGIKLGTEIRLMGENAEEKEHIYLEIKTFIQAKIDSFRQLRKQLGIDDNAHESIRHKLNEVENRTYLWVSLTFSELEKNPGIAAERLQRKLDELPPTVEAAYERILARSKDGDKTRKILQIIVMAARPLTITEINVALAVSEMTGSQGLVLEPETTFPATLQASCGSFLDIKNSRVHLIHQSAKKFLLNCGIGTMSLKGWKHSLNEDDSNYVLADICTSYLLLPEFEKDIVVDLERFVLPDATKHSFLAYAAAYWPSHLAKSGAKATRSLLQKAIRLIKAGSNECVNWLVLYLREHMVDLTLRDFRFDLEVAALTGCEVLLEQMFNETINSLRILEAVRPAEYTRNYSVLELLLRKGADPHCKTSRGDSYLGCAIFYGDVSLVKILLDKGADPNENIFGQPALAHAAACGYPEIVEMLLDNGACLEGRDKHDCRTALSFAAAASPARLHEYPYASRRDYLRVVEILLHKGADPLSVDNSDRTPLYYAIRSGKSDLIRLMLDSGVHPDSMISRDGGCLHVAAMSATAEVIDLLLSRGASLDSKNYFQRTPLLCAAAHENYPAVKRLLEHGAFPDSVDSFGSTPLAHAAKNGQIEILKELLAAKANPDTANYSGMTPLFTAVFFGKTRAVEILLEKVTNLCPVDSFGDTPLSWAQRSGKTEIVEMLSAAYNKSLATNKTEAELVAN
ncbi:hypothetical protein VTN96DRAFT_4407 [Rasamsonia emersonii]|uniref:Sex-determining protein fem-1 n=1 Tax=Rasamsonia emersonii (strain ATCC 16479 / CBS 393.64 / IMI 116815) TaxID=1408163 RepID=A0A0F4YXH1_RASE3|nr:Sex-determining protein fem-1 [Rasamsonia emersonii CBS 393.64]KKA22546.1 Sex-determining protein fem-1 [Rasamsonia emersonii CBS 393.64]